MNFTLVHNVAVFNSVSNQLIARIPEISYLLSSVLMLFASDYIMERLLIRRLRKVNFIARTFLFVLYGLLILPALTTIGALLLRVLALNPFKEWIILVLVICFFFVGVLLSIRYNIKMKLKV